MLAKQRHNKILQELMQTGAVRITDLVQTLGVSEMTVRRDIDALESKGLLKRVHGGAVPLEAEESELARAAVSRQVEKQFAQKVAGLIQPGQSVLLANGPASAAVASALVELPHAASLKLFTTSYLAARVLVEYADECHQKEQPVAQIEIIGGQPEEGVFVGPYTEFWLQQIRLDVGIFGTKALSERGMTTYTSNRVGMLRAAVQASKKKIVLLESRLWDRDEIALVAPLSDFDTVIVDQEPSIAMRRCLVNEEIQIEVVEELS